MDLKKKNSLKLIGAGPDHAMVWLTWRREPAMTRFNADSEVDLARLRERLRRTGHDLNDRRFEEYRWFIKKDDELVGTLSLKAVDWANQHGEIGYQIASSFHGQGLATAAVRLLIDKIFHETELTRIVARVHVDNLASQNVLRKLGFMREGRLRQHVLVHRQKVDQFIFGLLLQEWEPYGKFLRNEF